MSPSQPSTHRDGVEGGGGGCPVVRNSAKDQQEQQPSWDFSRLLWWKKKNEEYSGVGTTATGRVATMTAGEGSIADNDAGGGCPVVQHQQQHRTPSTPASVEESAKHSQRPQYRDQVVPLSTHRVISTIPRGGGEATTKKKTPTLSTTTTTTEEEVVAPPSTPSHQPMDANKWVYPSEQQFYNAMRRKGWSSVDETTIPDVVRIHNAVNERGWLEIQKWESLRSSSDSVSDGKQPKLVKFMGRPNDMSPKAWFNSKVLWYKPPFDRHDWYVESGGEGREREVRRYVIDFYNGNDNESTGDGGEGFTNVMYNWITGKKDETTSTTTTLSARRPPSMYLDVRPALDSPNALYDRTKMFVWDAFPGLCSAFFGGGFGGLGSGFGGGTGGRNGGGGASSNNTTATAASSSSSSGNGVGGGGGGAV